LKLLRIKFIRLKWAGCKSEWIIIEYRKVLDGKIPWKRTCGKTKTETGRHREDSSLLLNTRGWRILAGNGDIWRRRTARAVAALKNSRKERLQYRNVIAQTLFISKAAATLEPEPTQHSKLTFVVAYIARHAWLLVIRHVSPDFLFSVCL
jgi:hypothetical protein